MNPQSLAGIALVALAPALTPGPSVGIFDCKHDVVIVDTACIEAIATGVRSKRGRVSASGSSISNVDPSNCPKLKSFKRRFYKEKNGKEGYQEGDELLDFQEADLGAPSDNINVGSFKNDSGSEAPGVAENWELEVTDENGTTSRFGGTF